MNPAGIHALYPGWNGPEGPALQAKADAVRQVFQQLPMIPAMKRVVAETAKNPDWAIVRPPLVELDEGQSTKLRAVLNSLAFSMPNYPHTAH